jgi:hypothetical protein
MTFLMVGVTFPESAGIPVWHSPWQDWQGSYLFMKMKRIWSLMRLVNPEEHASSSNHPGIAVLMP